MRKRLIGWLYHWDGEYLWCYDEKICALSRININTLDVVCMVSPMEILKNGWYKAGNLVGWGDKIMIVPLEIGKKWVIYDKQNGNVEHDFFCTESYQSIAGNVIGDNFIVLPCDVYNPVLSIDLHKRKVVKKFDLRKFGLVAVDNMIILDAKVVEGNLFFLIKNSCFYGRVNNKEFQLIQIQGERVLECADFFESINWAVDRHGKVLYQFDKEGNILRELFVNAETEVGRIAVENKFVFLLPAAQHQIKVFDTDRNQMDNINKREETETLSIIETFGSVGYWEYFKKDRDLWFLPWRYSLQVVNLSTFTCSAKEILYADDFSEKMYTEYYRYVRKVKRFFYYENKNLEKYLALDLIKEKEFILVQESEKYFGKKIWETLR